MKHAMRYLAAIGLATIVVLLFLFTSAGTSSSELEPYFGLLLLINALVVLGLLLTVISLISRLTHRLRQKQFGSRMLMSLVLMISTVTIFPCVLIYSISTHLISQAFDAGVDSRVETALDSGVELSITTLERFKSEQLISSKTLADRLSESTFSQIGQELRRFQRLTQFSDLKVVNEDGYILASATDNNLALQTKVPSSQELLSAKQQGQWVNLEGDPLDIETSEGEPLRIRSVIVFTNRTTQQTMFLQAQSAVPDDVAQNINATIKGLQDYQQILVTRLGLRKIYNWSLILTLSLAVLCAILGAFFYARRMTAPIRQLAEGTRQATQGKLQPIQEFSGADEINELTTAFNGMIRQLNDAWTKLEKRQASLEQYNVFLERILESLSSGVIVLNHDLRIKIANMSTVKIIGNNALQIGVPLVQALPELAEHILPLINEPDSECHRDDITLNKPGSNEPITLMIRTSAVPLDDGQGFLVVIDDMSQAVAAQRVIAWGEVARRLAHEIKNPLTPIQLAAERLELKLEKHLPPSEQELLHRYTRTIINEVGAMKQMVNDFRDYAKLPKPRMKPLDLNNLLDEACVLYHQNDFQISMQFSPSLPNISADRTQILQVIHNVLSNAREAHPTGHLCKVTIKTEKTIENNEKFVKLTVNDNGEGFPKTILEKAFEPYITTKSTGTGLGLPMVKKIIEEHGGKVMLSNSPSDADHPGGAVVSIWFPILD